VVSRRGEGEGRRDTKSVEDNVRVGEELEGKEVGRCWEKMLRG
jgi:hypothetical protein